MIASFFYTLIIFPIIQIIELSYVFSFRMIHNYGLALIGVSIVVSLLTLPIYLVAEKHQENERLLKNKLKIKVNRIKETFRGDEQFMVLSTFYRQNNYHPIYAMRNSLSILFQIPFFIAAYLYLSHLEILRGISFLTIKNLAMPDGILIFGQYHLNVLPVIMTLINAVSSTIYTRGLAFRDKFQSYGIAIIFLILLYNSPSGLVLYWTTNNVFSLIKNIILKNKQSKRVIYGLLFFIIIILDIFLLFFHKGYLFKRILTAALFSSIIVIPVIVKKLSRKNQKFLITVKNIIYPISPLLFIFSCLILFILHGGIVPSSLIASSVTEFSFLDQRTSPFPFIARTLMQSAGIFLFWPLCLYFLFSDKVKHIFTYIFIILSGISLIDVFLIFENFGFFTTTMVFSEPKPFSMIPGTYILNMVIVAAVSIVLFLLIYNKKLKILLTVQIITIFALIGNFVINTSHIQEGFIIAKQKNEILSNSDVLIPEYNFSKKGKNVLVIMLDAAIGFYMPYHCCPV